MVTSTQPARICSWKPSQLKDHPRRGFVQFLGIRRTHQNKKTLAKIPDRNHRDWPTRAGPGSSTYHWSRSSHGSKMGCVSRDTAAARRPNRSGPVVKPKATDLNTYQQRTPLTTCLRSSWRSGKVKKASAKSEAESSTPPPSRVLALIVCQFAVPIDSAERLTSQPPSLPTSETRGRTTRSPRVTRP